MFRFLRYLFDFHTPPSVERAGTVREIEDRIRRAINDDRAAIRAAPDGACVPVTVDWQAPDPRWFRMENEPIAQGPDEAAVDHDAEPGPPSDTRRPQLHVTVTCTDEQLAEARRRYEQWLYPPDAGPLDGPDARWADEGPPLAPLIAKAADDEDRIVPL